MYYTLVYYPQLEEEAKKELSKFREKYDPYADVWKPHLTFVFPISSKKIDKGDLQDHLKEILSSTSPFHIRLGGLQKSWDHWLFVLLKEGDKKVKKLHRRLYSGPLQPFLRKDIDYIPHISIGLFAEEEEYDLSNPQKVGFDRSKYNKALGEARNIEFDQSFLVDELTLETLNDELTEVVGSEVFKLKVK